MNRGRNEPHFITSQAVPESMRIICTRPWKAIFDRSSRVVRVGAGAIL